MAKSVEERLALIEQRLGMGPRKPEPKPAAGTGTTQAPEKGSRGGR